MIASQSSEQSMKFLPKLIPVNVWRVLGTAELPQTDLEFHVTNSAFFFQYSNKTATLHASFVTFFDNVSSSNTLFSILVPDHQSKMTFITS